ELRHALEALAELLRLDDACRFLGHVEDIAEFHHGLDLLAQSSDYEGTPNAVLAAMAMETPVVVTDVGGTGELIAPGVHGFLVPPNAPEALAGALEETIVNPPAAARRVAAARMRVERELSFEARTRAVESLYNELMHS